MEPMSEAEFLFRQGCKAYEENNLEAAAAFFEQAITKDPKHQGALVMLAMCKNDINDIDGRRALLERAQKVDPTSETGQRAGQLLAELPPLQLTDPGDPAVEPPSGNPQPRAFKIGDKIGGGRYEILEYIGAGRFGTTYKARDTKLNQLCVAKQLVPRHDADEKLQREVGMLVTLNQPGHESIPPIYEYLKEERCLVMKFIDGKTIIQARQLVDQQQKLSEQLPANSSAKSGCWARIFGHKRGLSEGEALRYMRDASSALTYMHTHGEVPKRHGDISPSNLIVDPRDHIWLIDFGLTQAIDSVVGRGGTREFIAPEQDKGNSEPRSDVYSLGKVFKFLTNSDSKPVRLSATFKKLLEHTTKKEVDERPTAGWVMDMLDQLLALRLARRQVFGLLIVIVAMLLLYISMFFPALGTLPEELNPFKSQLNGVQNQLTASEQNVARLTADGQSKQKLLSDNQQQLKSAQDKLADNQEALKQAQGELKDSQQKLNDITAERDSLKNQLKAARDSKNSPFPTKPITITAGTGSATSNLSKDRMTEFWTFEASGGLVTIDAKPLNVDAETQGADDTSLADPVLLLYGPDGQIIAYNDDIDNDCDSYSGRGCNAQIVSHISEAGIYTIQVTSYKYVGGDYPRLGKYQVQIATSP